MVPHSLTLFTRSFGEDCYRYQKMTLWNEGFPLQLASQCIDQDSLTYSCPESCKLHFEGMTSLAWDNLDDSENVSITCFRCRQQTFVPWTTRRGNGLADNGLSQLCQSCRFILRIDALLVQRLRRDLHALLEQSIPSPGTCWTDGTLAPNNATNELVKRSLGNLLLEETCPTNLFPNIVQVIEASAKAVGGQYVPMSRLHDIFEHYQHTPNSSCDLHAAVMRVSKSASMMPSMDWSESDLHLSVRETRYIEFLRRQRKASPRRSAVSNMDLMDPPILV